MNIKNGDLPAMPTIYADMAANGQREIYCDQTDLTKREQFAMAMAQGILSSDRKITMTKLGVSDFAHDAVVLADALLAELEKSK